MKILGIGAGGFEASASALESTKGLNLNCGAGGVEDTGLPFLASAEGRCSVEATGVNMGKKMFGSLSFSFSVGLALCSSLPSSGEDLAATDSFFDSATRAREVLGAFSFGGGFGSSWKIRN